MSEHKLDLLEIIVKSVAQLAATEDPEFGKEILVGFSDNTQVSIAFCASAAFGPVYSWST